MAYDAEAPFRITIKHTEALTSSFISGIAFDNVKTTGPVRKTLRVRAGTVLFTRALGVASLMEACHPSVR